MEPVQSPFPTRVGKHPLPGRIPFRERPTCDAFRVATRPRVFILAIALLRITGDPHLLKTSLTRSAGTRSGPPPAIPAEHNPQFPALNGRSVRNLRHLRAVKAVRGGVAAAAASFAVVVALGFGVPAYASATAVPPVRTLALQSLTVSGVSPTAAVVRDSYGVTRPPPLLQWPVDPSSAIVDGFGPRVSPCSGCSSLHDGVDYDAGTGAPVHAIAAGVVVETNNPGWAALGIHVAIQHVIDGQTITSAYGHMQMGSMPLRVGDTVFAGELIGRVGSTGASTGAHLHFEIRAGGTTPIDPVAWMRARLG
jgi:murein DD-endopeptidase MepM/ murein hydrolase activator NlpD